MKDAREGRTWNMEIFHLTDNECSAGRFGGGRPFLGYGARRRRRRRFRRQGQEGGGGIGARPTGRLFSPTYAGITAPNTLSPLGVKRG